MERLEVYDPMEIELEPDYQASYEDAVKVYFKAQEEWYDEEIDKLYVS